MLFLTILANTHQTAGDDALTVFWMFVFLFVMVIGAIVFALNPDD